ncbi:hypothetical protein Tco_0632800 [Tanacetum coccineum]
MRGLGQRYTSKKKEAKKKTKDKQIQDGVERAKQMSQMKENTIEGAKTCQSFKLYCKEKGQGFKLQRS